MSLFSDIPRRNCKELLDEGFTETGLYTIQPTPNSFPFTVFCDMDLRDGGWTVILRRVDDTVDFNKTWDYYTSGFGNLGGNFFLGLEKIWLLTQAGNMELHVGLRHPNKNFFPPQNAYKYSPYSHFEVGSSSTNYKLTVSGYESNTETAGDSLQDHSGKPFSTYDVDNDDHTTASCAQLFSGGWWFHNCFESNLNGKYYLTGFLEVEERDGIVWKSWTGEKASLSAAVMAIRPSSSV